MIADLWAVPATDLPALLAELTPAALAPVPSRPRSLQTSANPDGIATIQIRGPLLRYRSGFTAGGRATAMEDVAEALTAAVADPSIRGVLLDVDSPGSTVNGTQELGELLFAARGQKPIIAHVSGLGTSGAYWISSAADEVVAGPTAILGSIGISATVVDTSDADRRAGVRTYTVVSSQSPRKGLSPIEGEGRADVQRTLDAIATVFLEAVARNRGRSADSVARDYGAGGVLVGAAAVRAGLADRLGTFDQTYRQLVERTARPALPAPSVPGATTGDHPMKLAILAPPPRLSAGPPAPAPTTPPEDDDVAFARSIIDLDRRLHRRVEPDPGPSSTSQPSPPAGATATQDPNPHRGPAGSDPESIAYARELLALDARLRGEEVSP